MCMTVLLLNLTFSAQAKNKLVFHFKDIQETLLNPHCHFTGHKEWEENIAYHPLSFI